jgi:cobalamin biosynthesis protein CbiG
MSADDVASQLQFVAHLVTKSDAARHVGLSRGPSGATYATIHVASVEEAHELLDLLWQAVVTWGEARQDVVAVTPEGEVGGLSDMISEVVVGDPGDTHQ